MSYNLHKIWYPHGLTYELEIEGDAYEMTSDKLVDFIPSIDTGDYRFSYYSYENLLKVYDMDGRYLNSISNMSIHDLLWFLKEK